MERQKMKKKGFTLVELLVVIAIIAMLLAILMPALGKVRQLAQRIMCSTNLVGLGKAMMTYSTDDKYESFPLAGSPNARWDCGNGTKEGICSFNWYETKFMENTPAAPTATLSSSLYLLIKFADVSPEQFICPGSDQKKFELSKYSTNIPATSATNSFTDVWDTGRGLNATPIGSRGKAHNSYSYQMPMQRIGATPLAPLTAAPTTTYAATTTTNPAKPIMADRNPFWTDLPELTTKLYEFDCVSLPTKVKTETLPNGNAAYHQKDGQNVLYADQHSKFERQANIGIQLDNIYTTWGRQTIDPTQCPTEETARQCGRAGVLGAFNVGSKIRAAGDYYPVNDEDSYLVSDYDKPKDD